MAALYHSLFTEKGLELLRESIQNGTKLGITHMSFGDGNGSLPTPDAKFTQMVNEVYRTALNRLAPSKENPNWLEADGVIPSAVGGFNIREVGLWAGNDMVAYANYPPTYKPSGDQGTAQIKTIRIVLQIDNTANFELKIDASVVMATIQAVEDAKIELYANNTGQVETIADLLKLNPFEGRTVYVKGYYKPTNFALAQPYKGGGTRVYVESRKQQNDGFMCINGWVLQVQNSTVTPSQAGAKNDATFDSSWSVQLSLIYTGKTKFDDYYYCKTAVWFPVSKVIEGIGMWSCGLIKNGDGVLNLTHDKTNGKTKLDKNAVLVGYVNSPYSSYSEDCCLRNFSLKYSGTSTNTIGLYVPSACRSSYKNILIEDCDIGYQTSDSWLMDLNMVHVRNSRIAFYNGAKDGEIVVNGTSNNYAGTYAEVCSQTAYFFDTYQYSSMTSCAADKMPTTAKAVYEIYNTDIVIKSPGCEQIHTKLFEVNNGANVNVLGGQLILDNNFQQTNTWANALICLRGMSKLIINNTKFVISSESGENIAGLAAVNESSILEIENPAMHKALIGTISDKGDFNNFNALDVKIWNGSVAKVKTPYGGIERRSDKDLSEILVGFKNQNRVLDTYLSTKTLGYSFSKAFKLSEGYNLDTLLNEGYTGVSGQAFWNSTNVNLNYPHSGEVALIHQMSIDKDLNKSGSVPYKVQMCFTGANDVTYRTKVDANSPSSWYLFRTSKNTTVTADGTLKAASPIVKLYSDHIECNDEAEEQNPLFEKLGTGHYLVKNTLGFAQEGWWIEVPSDSNGNKICAIKYQTLQDGDIEVRTFKRKFDIETASIIADEDNPIDIPENMNGEQRWIDIRLHQLTKDVSVDQPIM